MVGRNVQLNLRKFGKTALISAWLFPFFFAVYSVVQGFDFLPRWTLVQSDYFTQLLLYTLAQSIPVGLICFPISTYLAFELFSLKPKLANLAKAIIFSCSVLPMVCAVEGLISVYGARGWLGGLLPFSLFGSGGIFLIHCFYNLAFLTLYNYIRLLSIPRENFALAATFGLSKGGTFRHLIWPVLARGSLFPLAVTFLYCFTDFAGVSLMGSSTIKTTLPVALVQNIVSFYRPEISSVLSLTQFLLCLPLFICLVRGKSFGFAAPTAFFSVPHLRQTANGRLISLIILCVSGGIFLLPVLALMNPWKSKVIGVLTTSVFWDAAYNTLLVSVFSAFLSTITALIFCMAFTSGKFKPALPFIALTIPAYQIIVGLLTLESGLTGSLPWVVFFTALSGVPFAYFLLRGHFTEIKTRFEHLNNTLNLEDFSRWFYVLLPLSREVLAICLIMTSLLALGDFAVIGLLGTSDFTTLSGLYGLYSGRYRFEEASAVGFWLGFFTLGVLLCLGALNRKLTNK